MNRYTLHVPLATNDGRHLGDLHHELEDRLLAVFGGFTVVYARGGYRSDALTITEDMALYSVDTGSPSALGALRQCAVWIKRVAEQDAVYLTRQAIDVLDI